MHRYDVVILPSFAQVESWRKRQAAACREGLFSQTVTTFNAWIADLWELHGDGRSIVDSLQRQVIMQTAFDDRAANEPDGGALTVSQGVVRLAAQCVRQAAGVDAFDRAAAQAQAGEVARGLDDREVSFLAAIGRYYSLLGQAGLIETGQAASLLAGNAPRMFPRPLSVLVANAAPPDWLMQSFFDACDMLDVQVEEAPGASGIGCMRDGVRLSFGFPSGRYAQPALVADIVRRIARDSSGAGGQIVVACKDPLSLHESIEQTLVDEGVACSVQALRPFSSTDFGRQFLSLGRVVEKGSWAGSDLSDAARPPFSGFDGPQALQIDRELRADRLAGKEPSLAALRVASDTFSQLEEVVSDPDADVLLGVFEQIAFTSPGRSDAWRAEQLAAVAAVRACTRAARIVGAPMDACMRVLKDAMVAASYESASQPEDRDAVHVVVTTQDAAAQMGPESCAHLVLCDLTSEDYPVADRDDAAGTLFGKLGLPPYDSMLARSRRTFAALQGLPQVSAVMVRPLNDWDGNPTYPCALLQELIDAYRVDPSDEDDVDGTFGLPEQLMEGLVKRGEESLYANEASLPRDARQPRQACVPAGSPENGAERQRGKVALSRRLVEGQTAGFCPSPSQVEVYLECPYKWFAQRRLNVEGLDEGFGPLERGTFAHEVLQAFYREFAEMGHAKVTPGNIDAARALMRQVADREELAQRQLDPGSGRYVAADQIEQHEVQACKDQLVRYLDFEAGFLPSFHPAYLEHEIGPQDDVEYAGRPFMGIVDRIDVDDAGNAVIVDYKGSVGAAHEIAGKNAQDPGKVQTRMYARAVQRALGLRVVGALYVSYGASQGCAGAVDGRVVEAAHLPGARKDKCRCAVESPQASQLVDDFAALSFDDMLDATEALVSSAIDSMARGEVQPKPATPGACTYCPVQHCPQRGA